MIAARFLLSLLVVLAALPAAHAQGLVFGTSDPTISIHSNFAGETITLFGNIEPSPDGSRPQGVFDVIFIIRGPVEDRVVRRKSRQFGIMLNADHALFSGLPSFYRLLSSRPIETILDPEVIAQRNLTVESQIAAAMEETTGNVALFESELVRLMGNANLFRTDGRGVSFLSPTFFSTRVVLPANVPNGIFLAQALVVQNGEIVAQSAQHFFVQKSGFERFVGEAAVSQPLLYGLATVLLALVTGWLGGVLFRR
ncbi:TIGR02186 family protein [Pelagibacterium sp.]|uniref:TIGR02186 family protein n=1 Tax=Pelagibacterium sp. TaxID=1967288 RepID=UPI003A900392